ncbi:MAG: hypothetical protein HN846_05370 [Candidatus Pacebacteria bacterium]|jgi:hypothetical protein|nr:hypothetical protein [Candidatus Paceibacterota bacterium]MBT4005372.1 hypothetical protein [Candidatus Paceibacterota bacterium]MBT4358894.1 hypothetical protein [Candidatus Paceibacterota bacterium]MBT4681099.1 hypothetical protein [Candidatus Paceibacterota bacterium]MBT6898409.1 hypothetical protein [Candidatus Paceibacterota bacterium]
MKKNFYLSLAFSLLILLGCGLFWFKDTTVPAVNPDEVAWVLDARFYNFRQQKKWEKFELAENPRFLAWSNDLYRLIDQPQLGKYVYGSIIQANGLDPWDESQTKFLYRQFASSRLDKDSIKTDDSYSDIISSINILRVFGSIASFVGITIFGLMTYLLTKSRLAGGLTSVFLFFHPTLHYLYRTAVPNNFQILLIIGAISLMSYLLNNIKTLDLKKKTLWSFVGILVAASTSIKLNGFFILVAPVFVWMVQEILASFSQENIVEDVIKKVKAYLIMLGSFAITFYFLEPELWGHPIRGLQVLFGARIDQHHRFSSSLAFKNYDFFETLWFLIAQFLKISDFWIVKLLLASFIIIGVEKIVGRLSDQYWFNLSLLITFMVISNTFYANVGFDRYAEWSIYIFSFLTALGVVEFLKIIHQKIRRL